MSYIRVTRGRWADPKSANSEAAQQALQQLFAVVRGLPGNQSYTGGIESSTGVTFAISVWDNAEHARSLGGEVSVIADKLRALGLQIEPTEIVEVTAPA